MAGDAIAGRYRLLEPLGRGAMSAVWLAEDGELARRVAVKVLGPNADRARFDREARSAAALSHPHICQLYDYGEVDGRPYMVLEYLPGGALEDRLRAGEPLDDAEAQRLASEIASGLAHAHARGLVHRDLKPANVLFDAEGRAKIADFGIARMGGTGTLTEAGTVLGTAAYISPEQAAGRPATPASDVYSFGVILFRMLTGSLPFQSRNAMELVRMHRDEPAPPVSELRHDAPPRLERLVVAALAKDPGRRPADGGALLHGLQDPDDATTISAPAARDTALTAATQVVPPPERARRAPARRVVLAGGLAAVLLGGGGAIAYVATGGGGGGGGAPETTTRQLTLPAVPPGARTTIPATTEAPTTAPATTAATTTAATTTAAATTEPTTTPATATTAPSTRETTVETTAPVTTTAATTTAPAPVPTETPPTTTAPPPPSTTVDTASPPVTTLPETTVATTATTPEP